MRGMNRICLSIVEHVVRRAHFTPGASAAKITTTVGGQSFSVQRAKVALDGAANQDDLERSSAAAAARTCSRRSAGNRTGTIVYQSVDFDAVDALMHELVNYLEPMAKPRSSSKPRWPT